MTHYVRLYCGKGEEERVVLKEVRTRDPNKLRNIPENCHAFEFCDDDGKNPSPRYVIGRSITFDEMDPLWRDDMRSIFKLEGIDLETGKLILSESGHFYPRRKGEVAIRRPNP